MVPPKERWKVKLIIMEPKVKLSKKAFASRKAYLTAWRKRNPEKVLKYYAQYWEKRAAKEDKANSEIDLKTGNIKTN